jgi:single-stranded DNA-specific DHH superfamily exonuclease
MKSNQSMLNKKEVAQIQEELKLAQSPLFFYDDDPDGLCSYIIMYKYIKEGKGIIVKSSPVLKEMYVRKVTELNPDKIFILDKPLVQTEFIDQVKKPIIWIDHHEIQNNFNKDKVKYYNPKKNDPDAYIPTTRLAYQINEDPKLLWVAMVGCLGDYYYPDFVNQFIEKYPSLLSEDKGLDDAKYNQPVGKLVNIFSFLLKGSTTDVKKNVSILMKLENPEEILNQTSAKGRYLYKKFEPIDKIYQELIKKSKKYVNRSKILLFPYEEDKISLTADLANYLTYKYPQKIIIIARKKSGEYKCSIRAKFPIREGLTKSLIGINGYGGGHDNACGAVIKEEDWEKFLTNFKENV